MKCKFCGREVEKLKDFETIECKTCLDILVALRASDVLGLSDKHRGKVYE